MKKIATLLEWQRTELGYTRDRVRELAGVGRSQCHKALTGDWEGLNWATIHKVAEALQLAPEELFRSEGHANEKLLTTNKSLAEAVVWLSLGFVGGNVEERAEWAKAALTKMLERQTTRMGKPAEQKHQRGQSLQDVGGIADALEQAFRYVGLGIGEQRPARMVSWQAAGEMAELHHTFMFAGMLVADDWRIVEPQSRAGEPVRYVPFISCYEDGSIYPCYRREDLVRGSHHVKAQPTSGKAKSAVSGEIRAVTFDAGVLDTFIRAAEKVQPSLDEEKRYAKQLRGVLVERPLTMEDLLVEERHTRPGVTEDDILRDVEARIKPEAEALGIDLRLHLVLRALRDEEILHRINHALWQFLLAVERSVYEGGTVWEQLAEHGHWDSIKCIFEEGLKSVSVSVLDYDTLEYRIRSRGAVATEEGDQSTAAKGLQDALSFAMTILPGQEMVATYRRAA